MYYIYSTSEKEFVKQSNYIYWIVRKVRADFEG